MSVADFVPVTFIMIMFSICFYLAVRHKLKGMETEEEDDNRLAKLEVKVAVIQQSLKTLDATINQMKHDYIIRRKNGRHK